MVASSFKLRLGSGYVVEDRFPAVIEEGTDGVYSLKFAEDTNNVFGIAESVNGSKAVLSIGLVKSKRRKVVIEPSPLLREGV